MKILFLFSSSRIEREKAVLVGTGHDNHFNGMFRLRKHGVETAYLDPEHVIPARWVRWYRRIFGIWWMHVPLFPILRRYDVVFAGGAYGALLVKALLRLRRPKWVIYDANVSGTIGDAKNLRQKVFKWAVSKCEGVVALSQAEEDTLRAMFGEDGPHVKFLYEGVDTDYFKPINLPEQNFILSVGLDLGRDFGTLIKAVRGLPVELKIATRPERVQQYKPLPKNVTAQFYSHEELQKLYAQAKCVVITLNMRQDTNDSMGTYAVIEARASGKVVIATKTKALLSYIREGVDGYLVPKHDVQAVRAAVERTLALTHAERKEMGMRAREFTMQTSDAAQYARQLFQFMCNLDRCA